MQRMRPILLSTVAALALATCSALGGLGAADAAGPSAGAAAGRAAAPADSPGDWPMFHQNATHAGVAADTTVSASSAADLGVVWQANTGAAAYSSPILSLRPALGRTLVYVGNQNGTMTAYDATTGERVWYFRAGASIQTTPALANGVLYFGSSDHKLYALNADTGAVQCSFTGPGVISASPVVVDPDGTGALVYFGDNGLTGSDDGGHEWAINAVDPNPAADCSLRWSFNGFGDPPGSVPDAGSWSPPAFATDVNGRPLIVFGGSSPDCAVYALDATTGQLAWRFQTEIFMMDNDVGAGTTISAPGVNGFADGVVYATGKDRITYALNLRTGEKLWEFSIRTDQPSVTSPSRSTAALDGDRLYLGYGSGVLALNAITGAKLWSTNATASTTLEFVTSPVVSGPEGGKVVIAGDFSGALQAFRADNGRRLWSFQTGSFLYASPLVSQGRVYEVSSSGYLYAFAPGGVVGTPPDTVLSSPANGSTVPNPSGVLAISGSASDDTGVAQVLVSIKDTNNGRWWDAVKRVWSPSFQQAPATLDQPGATSTGWTSSVPVGANGGKFQLLAEAVDADGLHDLTPASNKVNVTSSTNPPDTVVTSPVLKQVFHFPGGVRASFPITVTGSASDTAGANPGVKQVQVVIKNREHNEYYCGGPCPEAPTAYWSPTHHVVLATLDSPGATSTTWSLTIDPIYDHPHSYSIAATAIDNNNNADPWPFRVGHFCVRDPGNNLCA